jgi:hypothetical protein
MGQYGNQPDFGTIVEGITIGAPFPPSAIFVGELLEDTLTCTLRVLPVGNSEDITFTGISAGTFLPIIITKVISLGGVAEEAILVYR